MKKLIVYIILSLLSMIALVYSTVCWDSESKICFLNDNNETVIIDNNEINYFFIQKCNQKVLIKDDKTFGFCKENYIFIDNKTKLNYSNQKDVLCIKKIVENYINTTFCENVSININGYIFNYRDKQLNCNVRENTLICDSCFDGNCDSYCKSDNSEKCFILNLSDFNYKTTKSSLLLDNDKDLYNIQTNIKNDFKLEK